MDTAHVPSVFDVAAILITLTATLSWLNHKFLRLPSTVGLALMGVMASLLVLAIDFLTPRFHIGESVRAFIATVDFEATLMQGMLSFLLFAGALHVDLSDLRRHRWQVGVLSTLGVLVSTAIVGFGLMWLTACRYRAAADLVSVVWRVDQPHGPRRRHGRDETCRNPAGPASDRLGRKSLQ